MILTLSLNEKLVLVTAASNVTLNSIRDDMLAGRIKHDPATKTGRQITAIADAAADGTITIASIIKGDLDANGGKTGDDFSIGSTIKVALGDGIVVLDENNVIEAAFASA